MVYIDGLKYACEGCIKGHRSSACRHTERPLFEIKKKGRPITQCEHCRQLRKTKQVHVKCSCGDANRGDKRDPRNTSKGVKRKLPTPITLSNELGSSSGTSPSPAPQQAPSSKSKSKMGAGLNICSCDSSGQCTCATPIPTKKAREPSSDASSVAGPATPPPAQPFSSCCAGKIKPVQTPSPQTQGSNNGNYPSTPFLLEDLARTQVTPDVVHQTHHTPYEPQKPPQVPSIPYSNDSSENTEPLYKSLPTAQPVYPAKTKDIIPHDVSSPTSSVSPSLTFPYPISMGFGTCSCGVSCACPGCLEHSNTSRDMFILEQSCPYTCNTCNTCTGSYGFETAAQTEANFVPVAAFPSPQDTWSQHSELYPHVSSSSAGQFSGSIPEIPIDIPALQSSASTCCGGWCKCVECSCSSDCDADEEGTRGPLGFAVSGERGSCCGDGKQRTEYEAEGVPEKKFRMGNSLSTAVSEGRKYPLLPASSEYQSQSHMYRTEYPDGNSGQGVVGYPAGYDGWMGEPGSANDLCFEM